MSGLPRVVSGFSRTEKVRLKADTTTGYFDPGAAGRRFGGAPFDSMSRRAR